MVNWGALKKISTNSHAWLLVQFFFNTPLVNIKWKALMHISVLKPVFKVQMPSEHQNTGTFVKIDVWRRKHVGAKVSPLWKFSSEHYGRRQEHIRAEANCRVFPLFRHWNFFQFKNGVVEIVLLSAQNKPGILKTKIREECAQCHTFFSFQNSTQKFLYFIRTATCFQVLREWTASGPRNGMQKGCLSMIRRFGEPE